MKKLFAALLCLALLCLPCFAAGGGTGATGVGIDTLDAQYVMQENGSCAVTWQLTISFAEGVTEFDLPLPADAKNVSVDGLEYSLRRTSDATIVSLRPSGLASQVPLLIGFDLAATAAESRSGQVCTLRLLSPGRACDIAHYSATVAFPAPFDERPTLSSGYYGELIEDYNMTVLVSEEGVVTLRSYGTLLDHETLTMTLSLPSGYFDLRFLPGKTAKVDAVLFWLLLAAGVIYWFLFLRNLLFYPRAQAMPPLAGNAGVVPYVLTGDKPDLALMVMHWAALGYLTIAQTSRGKLYLKRQMDMGSERKGYEIRIFRSLFDRTDLRSAYSEEFRSVRTQAPLVAKAAWKRRLFSPKGGKPLILRLIGALACALLCMRSLDLRVAAQAWRWYLILPLSAVGGLAGALLQPVPSCLLRRGTVRKLFAAALALLYLLIVVRPSLLLVVGVLAQLLIGLALLLGGRRTRQGFRLATEYFGLRRYYRTVDPAALRELIVSDPQYFYRVLPYADALRCSDQLAKKLEGIRLERCTWLTSEAVKPNTAAGFLPLYRRVADELRGRPSSLLANLILNLSGR